MPVVAKSKIKGQPHRFRKGDPRPEGAGRAPGKPNRTTSLLRSSILNAAEFVGNPKWSGRKGWQPGPGGLEGYLRWLALKEPKSFAMLLGRILPLQVTGEGGGPVRVIDDSMTAAAAALAYQEALKSAGPPMIDVTPEESMPVRGSLPRVIPGRALSTQPR